MPAAAERPVSPATLARETAGPPERLETGPLVLRRMRAHDAGDIAAVVGESLEHLRPWMPWATKEAADHRSQLARISEADELWAAGTDYIYAIFARGSAADGEAHGTPGGRRPRGGVAGGPDGALAGTIGLHRKAGATIVEIGYWIAAAHTRRGYGTAAARAMTSLAATLPGVRQVEIQVDEANVASAGIPRKLGYRLDRIEDHEPEAPGERGRRMIWLWDCAGGDRRDGAG
jgi:RimJ/RimL family protein N-acetyltransferase